MAENDNTVETVETPETPLVTEINLNTMTAEELNTLINTAKEEARKEEKSKLHSKIEKEKVKATSLHADLDNIKTELDVLKQYKEEKELENLSEKERLEKLAQIEAVRFKEAELAANQRFATFENEIKRLRLGSFRDQLLRESGLDSDFEMFVDGDSEEAIQQSIVKAQEMELKFAEKYKPKSATVETTPDNRLVSPPITQPAAPAVSMQDINIENAIKNAKNPEDLDEIKAKLGINV